MKRDRIFRKIISSPWFLASLPAIIIILSIPPLGSRYQLQIEESGKLFLNDIYTDLNSDKITEVVRTGKGYPYYFVLVLDNDLRIHDQWNLKDTINNELSVPFFGNYDSDKFNEIYIFSYTKDSVFLNINEFFDAENSKPERIFITKVGLVNKTITSNSHPAGFFDKNEDGFSELYFTISTGFALVPRLYYCLDIANKKLISSDFIGVNCGYARAVDADGDNKPEIFGLMSASGNYKVPTPYTDKSTWLMVMNENLKFEFQPVEFPGLTNSLEINAYKNGGEKGYLLSHVTASADPTVQESAMLLFSTDGKKIREVPYSTFNCGKYPLLIVLNTNDNDRIFIIDNNLIELDNNFKIINKVKSPLQYPFSAYAEDINADGTNEFLLFSAKESKLVLYNASLKKLAEADINIPDPYLKFSHYFSKENIHKLQFTSSQSSWFAAVKKNNLFYMGYLAYTGIYMLLVLFIVLINRINTYKVQQKERLNQRLLTLQLQGIKSQLDPHFTFNTLNSVASLIYTEDRQAAYDYMTKFTQLLRGMINDAEKIYRTLYEELEFVTTYLELEKLRFGEKFNYTIEIGDSVSQKEQVPKMVLQTFVENSIKHGIMPCELGGILIIRVEKENNYLKLVVEDNGIGRKKAEGQSSSTGKGLKLTSEFYEILNQINRKPIRHLITDLYNESGSASGTRVEIWVPLTD